MCLEVIAVIVIVLITLVLVKRSPALDTVPLPVGVVHFALALALPALPTRALCL